MLCETEVRCGCSGRGGVAGRGGGRGGVGNQRTSQAFLLGCFNHSLEFILVFTKENSWLKVFLVRTAIHFHILWPWRPRCLSAFGRKEISDSSYGGWGDGEGGEGSSRFLIFNKIHKTCIGCDNKKTQEVHRKKSLLNEYLYKKAAEKSKANSRTKLSIQIEQYTHKNLLTV